MKWRIRYFWIAVLFAFLLILSGCVSSQSADDNRGSVNPRSNSPEEQGGMVALLDEDLHGDKPAEMERTPRMSELILGPGDEVEVFVYQHENLSRTLKIGASGKAMYPMVGDIEAAGLSIFELRDIVVQGLSRYIVEPDVTVRVMSVQSQKIIVLGEVNSPGFFYAETSPTVLEIVAQAGGFTSDGELDSVVLIRGDINNPHLTQLDIKKAIAGGDLTDNLYLKGGDIIYIPRTKISDLDMFFSHLSNIISPFIQVGTGYLVGRDIFEDSSSSRITISNR